MQSAGHQSLSSPESVRRGILRNVPSSLSVPDHSGWVSDSQQPFVEQEGLSTDVLFMEEKQPLVFPCRVTHPDLTAALVKDSPGDPQDARRQVCSPTLSVTRLHIAPNALPATHPHPHLRLRLQIIRNIVLILAAITLWRVCPFVCVHQRIRVKVCADVFVSAGAEALSEGLRARVRGGVLLHACVSADELHLRTQTAAATQIHK